MRVCRREKHTSINRATENVWTASWNEGFTMDDVEDMLRGLRKVSEHYGSQR